MRMEKRDRKRNERVVRDLLDGEYELSVVPLAEELLSEEAGGIETSVLRGRRKRRSGDERVEGLLLRSLRDAGEFRFSR